MRVLLVLVVSGLLLSGCGMMQLPTAPSMSADQYIQVMKLQNASGCSVVTFRGTATPYADVQAKAAVIATYGAVPPDLATCIGALPTPLGAAKPGPMEVLPNSPVDRLMRLLEDMR